MKRFNVYQKVDGQKQCSCKTNDGIWPRVYQKVEGQKQVFSFVLDKRWF